MRERLKSRRIDMGITLQEVADLIGVEKPTAQRYESGTIKKIDTLTVEKLAKAVRCSPAYLMGWQTEIQDIVKEDSNTHIENNLVKNYRSLNVEGQEKIIDYVDDIVTSGKYKKLNQHEMGNQKNA